MDILKTLGLNKQAERWSSSLTRKVLIEMVPLFILAQKPEPIVVDKEK